MRLINIHEKEALLNNQIKSNFSLGVLFYIMGFLLPFLTCMCITGFFLYFYIFLIGLLPLIFKFFIYPILFKKYINTQDIYMFQGKIISCKEHYFYYYVVEIMDDKKEKIMYSFPVYKEIDSNTSVKVIMLEGTKHYGRFFLLDSKNHMLTSKKSRFDLV